MIKVKLEINKNRKIIFKVKVDEKDRNNIFFKRAIIEGKPLKKGARYNYEIPLRFFIPICSNVGENQLIIDKNSILSYLEFSDYYDENYYTEVIADARYMKKWREEGCPDIYKITIDPETLKVKKEIAFKKPRMSLNNIDI
ncbi:MAG: hypothetical protein E6240_08630 [Clostridium butyricum]|nr:hypothetical protein [Clostridium butyricum]